MKTKLILLILFVLSACTFQMEVLNTPTPLATTQGPESILVPFSSPTPTPSALPTALPAPTLTATPRPGAAIQKIGFAANSASQNMGGDLAAGESQTYSLTAFQGQIMSVSILAEHPEQQNSYELEIQGDDGMVLCPLQDYGCPFWRGALPSTQEYQITVRSQLGGHYTLQVAINPPGEANQYFDYYHPLARYQLSFPDEFALAQFPGASISKIPPQFVLQYIDTQQYLDTNLGEAYFMVGASNDPQQVATCTEPVAFGGPETIVDHVTINGNPFTKSEGGGVAAGNIYEQTYYRTTHNGICYEVTYFIHYGNIGNYVPGEVREFDRARLLQKFEEILATITFY